MRIPCDTPPLCYNMDPINQFLNNEDVQKKIGAEGKWRQCNLLINKIFMGDWMLHDGGIDIVIYAGDVDYICNWLGNKAWTKALNWNSKDKFNSASDDEWQVDGKTVAKLRSAD